MAVGQPVLVVDLDGPVPAGESAAAGGLAVRPGRHQHRRRPHRRPGRTGRADQRGRGPPRPWVGQDRSRLGRPPDRPRGRPEGGRSRPAQPAGGDDPGPGATRRRDARGGGSAGGGITRLLDASGRAGTPPLAGDAAGARRRWAHRSGHPAGSRRSDALWLTLDRPERRNAYSARDARRAGGRPGAGRQRSDVRAVHLRGEGPELLQRRRPGRIRHPPGSRHRPRHPHPAQRRIGGSANWPRRSRSTCTGPASVPGSS